MTTLVAAVGALGLVLVFSGLTTPPGNQRNALMAPIDALTQQAGIARLTSAGLIVGTLVTFAVSFVLIAGMTRSLIIGTVLAGLLSSLPAGLVAHRARKKRTSLREAWPDAIATMIASVRAGVSLPESCLAMADRGPLETRPGFTAFASAYRATGSFRTGLERLRRDMADPVADRVAAALELAHEVGGSDLVRVLRTLGDFVRDDIRVRREIEARWSWTLTAARLAAGAPWVILALMATRPEAARAYGSSAGVAVIIGGFVATAVGYRLMLRAARLPEDPRLG